jgi:hypothetical protein
MGINGGTGIVGSGAALGGSGIHINRGGGQYPSHSATHLILMGLMIMCHSHQYH